MAVEIWKANEDIHKQMMALVATNHPDLALCVDEIVIVFREKAGKAGGQVVLGNSKKVAAIANAIGNTDYKFVLEIAADQWENELTSRQKEALLDHLLCACRVDEDPKSGNIKYTVAKPDIAAYSDNVERYGMWFPREESEAGEDVADLLPSAQ
jgi:hypothetical protein